jgi:hypothetical protein
VIHDFDEDLRRSHAASDLPIWLEIYQQAFPDLVACVDHRKDGEHQRAGIDRSLTLESSKQILIDEKIRWPNPRTGRVYEDIALEYLSDVDRKRPGWVCKPLRADFICYAIAALGKAYLLPVPQLQQAWRVYGGQWLADFPFQIDAPNRGYVTRSCGVPPAVLFKAIGECLRVRFTAIREAA